MHRTRSKCFALPNDRCRNRLIPHRTQWILSAAVLNGWGLLLSATVVGQSPAQSEPVAGFQATEALAAQAGQNLSQASPTGKEGEIASKPQLDHGESPSLGVIVAPCPADAVCVRGTVWQSPAEQAGITEGDYILTLNGEKVSTPSELRRAVEKSNPDEQVTLELWRDGEKFTKQLYLASQADELPPGQRAWFGVQIEDSQKGVELVHVIEHGPADKAGLQHGDVIQKINDQAVESVEEFVDRVADLGPGAMIELMIKRGDERQLISAELGTIDDAPLSFLRQAFGAPSTQGQSATTIEADAIVDAALDAFTTTSARASTASR
jgi:serine protease Do